MSLPSPSFLHLPRASLARRDVVRTIVRRCAAVRAHARAEVTHAFAFKDDELLFARMLLDAQSRLWLYRTNQRAFAGDFVIVDVSSPIVARRRAFAVDLKRGESVRVHDGACLQLRNARHVITEIAATGVVDASRAPIIATGDARALIDFISNGA
jgi:hypothetical protein